MEMEQMIEVTRARVSDLIDEMAASGRAIDEESVYREAVERGIASPEVIRALAILEFTREVVEPAMRDVMGEV